MSRQTGFQHPSLDLSSGSYLRPASQQLSPTVRNAGPSHIKPTNPRHLYTGLPEMMRNGQNDRRGSILSPSQVSPSSRLDPQGPTNSYQREQVPSEHAMYHVQSHRSTLPQPHAREVPSGRYSTHSASFQSRQRQDGIRNPSQVRSPHYQPDDFIFPGGVNNSTVPFGSAAAGWDGHSNAMLAQRSMFDDLGRDSSPVDSMSWNEISNIPLIPFSPSDSQQWSDYSYWPSVDTTSSISSSSRRTSSFDAPFAITPHSTSSSSAPHSQSSRTSSPLSTIDSKSPQSRPCSPISPSGPDGTKMCSHCKATSTPLWRRDPQTLKQLCNACGLYLQQRHKLRPQELIDADADDDTEEELPPDWTGPECSHCHTHNTSVWRRSKEGAQLCNACGVYRRLRGKDRPLKLKRNKIKPRAKHNST